MICAECGDGVWHTGEICDDGNLNNNDGCSSSCLGACTMIDKWGGTSCCGDGVYQKDYGEECDDANEDNTDGCSEFC